MTVRPPRPCAQPGCPELVRGANPRCPEHAQERREPYDAAARKRDPARYRYYRSPAWKALRKRKVKRSPLCERCELRGRIVRAEEVHHKDGDWRNPADANLVSLCATCHRSEGGKEAQRRRATSGSGRGRDGES